MLSNTKKLRAGLAGAALFAAVALFSPAGASANCEGGGITPAEVDICTPTPKARLLANGMLIPPKAAPPRVKAVIAAANRIRTKPYIYGGGHGQWWDRGYDCSGSVSYALAAGGMLSSPETSGELESWGAPGPGRYITVEAAAGHVYMYVDGVMYNTAGRSGVYASRWQVKPVDNAGYVTRHWPGL